MSFDAQAVQDQARLAIRNRDWPAALALWQQIVDHLGAQAPPAAFVNLSFASRRLKDPSTALAHVKKGLAAHPAEIDLVAEQALVLADLREWPVAIDSLENVLIGGRDLNASGYLSLAKAHQRCGNLDFALRAIDLASSRYPEKADFPRLREEVERAQANISQLESFAAEIRGQDCVVFGSAPDPKFLDDRYREKTIVCCNGSALSLLQRFQMKPAMTFLHSHALIRPNESDVEVREALAQVPDVGKLVILQGKETEYDLSPVQDKCAAMIRFSWTFRFAVLRRLFGYPVPNLDNSTGSFAVAVCGLLGAKSIELAGIALDRKGHSYNANNRYRNHISSDGILYGLMSLRGFPIVSVEPSIVMICTQKIE